MDWVRLVNHVPVYSGRLRRPASFDAWTRADGAPIVAELAALRRFALFGRTRGARKALWAELQRSAEQGLLAEAIDRAVKRFVLAAGEIASYPLPLPRIVIGGYRLVAVPRVTCNARGFDSLVRALDAHPDLLAVSGGPAFRQFFLLELSEAVDRALVRAAPSLRHPVPMAEGWYIVGFESSTSWFVPLTGPQRRGHFYVCETPPGGVKSLAPRRVKDAMAQVRATVAALSRTERDQMLREARAPASAR
jgi:hypothetical protein